MKTAITAGTLFTPLERIDLPLVTIEEGKIIAVSSRIETELPLNDRHLDYPDLVLAPGFIDIHIHGGSGHDVMEANDAALVTIETGMARYGVTGYLATTVTAPEDRILRALEYLGKATAQNERKSRTRLLGIHLEGPFISDAKRGVHPPENLVAPSREVFRKYWEASAGTIRIMTIAPELSGATETIAEAKTVGVHSSIGHSNATYDEAVKGILAGADHATHTFNAMRPLDHREPGVLGAVLSDDRLTADLIADGIHVDPHVVKLFLQAKGPERAVLITDAISATGMADGFYKLGAFDVEVRGDRCEYQGRLAGSVLTLDRAVRNVMSFAGSTLQQAIRLASFNPARLLAITEQKGNVAAGCDADLILLSAQGHIMQTIIAGEPCF